MMSIAVYSGCCLQWLYYLIYCLPSLAFFEDGIQEGFDEIERGDGQSLGMTLKGPRRGRWGDVSSESIDKDFEMDVEETF